MGTYNGHRSWAAWNISLWIGNDYGLYKMAQHAIYRTPTREEAAELLLDDLNQCGIYKTPDGALYTKTSILEALR